jgi:hypothetical protein
MGGWKPMHHEAATLRGFDYVATLYRVQSGKSSWYYNLTLIVKPQGWNRALWLSTIEDAQAAALGVMQEWLESPVHDTVREEINRRLKPHDPYEDIVL